ncbi:hypothetical protein [Amycolatopsis sp. NPDC059657]
MVIAIQGERIVLRGPNGETASFKPLQAGRLRAALRDALVDGIGNTP